MKTGISLLSIVISLFLTLGLWNIEAHAQSYAPFGPQTNVPEATVTGGGWTRCYIDPYNNDMDADTVL
jgi:hypothetical protein